MCVMMMLSVHAIQPIEVPSAGGAGGAGGSTAATSQEMAGSDRPTSGQPFMGLGADARTQR